MRMRYGRWGGVAIVAALLPCAPVAAAPTPAGTRIENTAALTFGDGDRASSNTVTLAVDALLDVTVTADLPGIAARTDDAPLPVGFVVTNTGNATSDFTLSAAIDRAAMVLGIAAEPAGESGPARITLAAGESRHLFVLLRNAPAGAIVTLTATAARGHGAPGTVVDGATIGTTGASAAARTLLIDGATAAPRLDKFQSVVAPDGSARARPGAVVTYRLEARFAGPVPAVAVADVIPAGTVFVPGSITLDDRPLPDAAAFDGTAVRVVIGDVAAAGLHTIRFQTRIQ